jgi:hypothetical protein
LDDDVGGLLALSLNFELLYPADVAAVDGSLLPR